MNTRENQEIENKVAARHAVVLGGSLAGLLAARVLADHFDRVTLIERDAYPDAAEVRKGVPQANHVHGLLLRGRQVLEEFFPGLQDDMIAAGVPLVDMANDIAWFTRAGWGVRFPSEMRLAKVNKAPWLMATGEDYRYRETEGGKPNVMTRFMHWYMDRVLQLATGEVAVRSVLLQVFSMLLPPAALFRRAILFRVIREAIRPARPRAPEPRSRRQVLYETRYGRETS